MGKGNAPTGTRHYTPLQQRQLEAYNEAKGYIEKFLEMRDDPQVDHRRGYYKRLADAVSDIWIGRMNNFGKKLGLPTYWEFVK